MYKHFISGILLSAVLASCSGNTPNASPFSNPSVSPSSDPSSPTDPIQTGASASANPTAANKSCSSGMNVKAFTSHMQSFQPNDLKVGMKWSYEINATNILVNTSSEIISLKDDLVTIKITTSTLGQTSSKEITITKAEFNPYSSSGSTSGANPLQGNIRFCEAGAESVTVGAGSFNATRFDFFGAEEMGIRNSSKMSGSIWVAKGVGTVKVRSLAEISNNNEVVIIEGNTQLKEKSGL